MTHIYLSPHLDDAVLSCGGAIHRHVAAGEPVLVITLIAADVQPGTVLSPFAVRLHAEWGGRPQPFRLRRAEDLAALALLGAEAQHLDYLDAIYRTAGPDGRWMYTDGPTLFGSVHPGDPLAGEGTWRLADRLEEALAPIIDEAPTLYAPLGVGRHVDHQIVHAAARLLGERGWRVAFYEDYPYAERGGATAEALAEAGAEGWTLERVRLDAADVVVKAAAIGYHRSQLAILFGGAEAMPSRVWAFASTRSTDGGLAEQVWWPQ